MSFEKAASAGVWSAIDIILRQGVGFVVSIILARLLNPEDFGLMALLAFFVSLSVVFVQGGLTLALVQRRQTSHEEENAVFWANLIAGTVFALILIAIAPVVARFYGFPLMNPLMYVAAAQIVLSALGAVQGALLTRTLRFDLMTRAGISSSLLSGFVGVGAAFAGWGVWALAAQVLAMSMSYSIALWFVSDWRPAWRVRFRSIRALAGFGAHMSLSTSLELLYSQGFSLVIGKVYGLRDLGILNRAVGITQLPTGIISQIIARTALPLFAERAADPDALRRGFRMSVSLAMVLSLPLMVGLVLLSDLIVLTLLGPKWIESAPVLAVMAIGGVLLPIHILNLQLLLALGGSRDFLRLEIQKKIVGVILFGIGCFFGIMGVAYASVAVSVIGAIINASPTKASIGYGLIAQLNDLRGVVAAAAIMAVGVLGIKSFVALPPLPSLLVLTVVGALLYFSAGFLFRIDAFADLSGLANSVYSKMRRSVAAKNSANRCQ